MADNLNQFKVRIRRYLQEETASKSHWDDDVVEQLFNAHYRLRCTQLQKAYEGWFINVAQRDLEADVARYSFPDDFQRLSKLELVRTDGRTRPIQRFERHAEVNPPAQSGGDDYNPTYRLLSNGFVLEPTTTSDVANGIRIEYEANPTALTAGGDSIHPSFPNQLDEILVIDTAVACFDVEGQQESGQMRTLLRLRAEWDIEWQSFIDRRAIDRPGVTPFLTHYSDS